MTLADRLKFIKLVLMDIDGTLVTGPSESIENVSRQLRKLKRAGISFSVATGRTLTGAAFITREFLRADKWTPPIIAYNGAVVASPQETAIIYRTTIDRDVYKKVIAECEACRATVFVYTCAPSWNARPIERVFARSDLFGGQENDFNGMPIQWAEELDKIDPGAVCAVLVSQAGDYSDMEKLRARLIDAFGSRLRVTSSGNKYLELAGPRATKLDAMRELARRLDLQMSEILAIGDNFNDSEMIAEAGIGVAVGNSPIGVKKHAAYVCEGLAAEGVVEILRLLLATLRFQRIAENVRTKRPGGNRDRV